MVDFNDDDDWKELVQDVDGFWNEETQETVQGRVVSIVDMELAGRDTLVAVLTLTQPCDAVIGSKKEKKVVRLVEGQAIGVVIKHKLGDMPSFVDNQCEVQIRAKEKITLENNNTMWKYAIRFRGRRTGFATAQSKPEARSTPATSGTKTETAKTKKDDLAEF